jgi:hypothetical protein
MLLLGIGKPKEYQQKPLYFKESYLILMGKRKARVVKTSREADCKKQSDSQRK